MRIGKEVYEAHRRLSKISGQFLEFVENNPGALKASNFRLLDLKDELFVLQPWPSFLNRTVITRFQEINRVLFQLIKSIPGRIFGNDIKKISAYYEIPRHLVEFQLEGLTSDHLDQLVARGDFILTGSGLKCLEYNVSTTLGGWDLPIWESLYLNTPIISKFLKEYGVKINNENLIRLFMEHIVRSTLGKIGDDSEMNILFVLKEYKKFLGTKIGYLNELFRTALKRQNIPLKGGVFMCDFEQVEKAGKAIYYKGKQVHALIEMYKGDVPADVVEVFKAGNLRLFDGPVSVLLENKLNLALLSDYNSVDKNLFSDEEKRVIDKHVPWTRKITPGYTTYGSENIILEDFILSHKDKLVIKPGAGFGGEGVYIGPHTPGTKWQEVLTTAIGKRNWLVQEYVKSLPFLYQSGEDGCELHDMAWGFFILGSQYGGGWTRVLPQKEKQGVINCHAGAKAGVIFEVDEQ